MNMEMSHCQQKYFAFSSKGGDHLHHIIVATDQDQDLVPTVQVSITILIKE